MEHHLCCKKQQHTLHTVPEHKSSQRNTTNPEQQMLTDSHSKEKKYLITSGLPMTGPIPTPNRKRDQVIVSEGLSPGHWNWYVHATFNVTVQSLTGLLKDTNAGGICWQSKPCRQHKYNFHISSNDENLALGQGHKTEQVGHNQVKLERFCHSLLWAHSMLHCLRSVANKDHKPRGREKDLKKW